MTLSDFLLARVEEDFYDAQYEASWVADPLRALAEVEVKRRVIGAHPHLLDADDSIRGCAFCPNRSAIAPDGSYCLTMRSLSVPYADHPDYREEWRP